MATMRRYPKYRSRPWLRRIVWTDDQGRRNVRHEYRWWTRLVPQFVENWWQRHYDDRFISKRPPTQADRDYAVALVERLRAEGKM